MRKSIRIAGCFILFALLIGAGAVAAQDSESPSLTGVAWQWETFIDVYQSTDVLMSNYTVTFNEDGTFHVRADCRDVLGSYTANPDDSTISILLGPSTMIMCPPGSLSDAFTFLLSQVAIYSFTDSGELVLDLPYSSGTLTLSAQPQVTGTISYMQRIALPPDAFVRVELRDVSLADAPAVTIGSQVFETGGAQVPFPFVISYPADAIQENHTYSIFAQITDAEGNLLFITDTSNPVITRGNPTTDIEVVLVQV
jgi:putative lipoprotein